MQITQHRTSARGLADLLLPFALVEDGVLLQQDGSLLVGWSYRGPDMHSATHTEMHALATRLNAILRLGSGWMIHTDLVRSRAPGYPNQGSFPDTVTRVIDYERRQQFMNEGSHFESEHFFFSHTCRRSNRKKGSKVGCSKAALKRTHPSHISFSIASNRRSNCLKTFSPLYFESSASSG
jgi:type IV secretory pathway VirB4 component